MTNVLRSPATPNLVVITGAGASYDSALPEYAEALPIEDRCYRPPLAKNLFANHLNMRQLIQKYPDVQPLAHLLAPGGDQTLALEARLQRIQDEAATNDHRHVQLMAMRFYLRNLLQDCSRRWSQANAGVTGYRWLVDQITQLQSEGAVGHACFVTFNYDTLLDEAISRSYRRTLGSMPSYVSGAGDFSYVKLHGSWNWVQILPTARRSLDPLRAPENWLIENAHTFNDPSQPKVVMTTGDYESTESPAVPAVAIPVQTKDDSTFMAPADHLADLQKRLADRNTLFLVIGWQAQEAHFLKMWTAAREGLDTKVFIVDQTVNTAKAVAQNICRGGLRRIATHIFDPGQHRATPTDDVEYGFHTFSRSDDIRRIPTGEHGWVIHG